MFLVDLRSTGSAASDVVRMHEALRHAVSRRAAGGADVRWAGGLHVPSDGRCLCLVEAAAEAEVLRARDLAGLHAAPVRPVHLLPLTPMHHPNADPEPTGPAPRKESS